MSDLSSMFASLQLSLAAHRPGSGPDEPLDRSALTPVTVLTGFLGAGKTTLLNALLTAPPRGLTVLAVVNDVGALNFDPSLLVDPTLPGSRTAAGPDVVELANGCGCCAADGQLRLALERVAVRRPDLVVLEASGMADPFAVAQVVEASPCLRLDRIVTAIDARSFRAHMTQPMVASVLARQIDAGEVVVLTRTDDLSTAETDRAVEEVAELAPGRTIATSGLADPAVEILLSDGVKGAAPPRATQPGPHDLLAVTLDQEELLDPEEIGAVLAARLPTIVRCKGRLATPTGDVLVQSSGSGWSVSGATNTGDRLARVTIVGTDPADLWVFASALGLGAEARAEIRGGTRSDRSRR